MSDRKHLARLGTVFVITAVIILLIIWRYVSLMLLTPDDPRTATSDVRVERGPILDRNGRVLAIQTKLDSVTAWVPDVEDPATTAQALAATLNLDVEAVRSIFEDRPGFAYIKRKISDSESVAMRSLVESGRVTGIGLLEESTRTYPEQRLAAPILGIVDINNRGLEGLELEFDETLAPVPPDGSEGELYGNQLFLTLDLSLQYAAEQLASEALGEQLAESVLIIAMDAQNGDILAMAGTPSFNPNTFTEFPAAYRINRTTAAAYEPGSVFKVFSMAALLDLGGVSAQSTFVCRGYYEHPDIPEPIDCLGTHGVVGPTEIIKYSCNAGAAYASEQVGAQPFYEVIRSFGFGETTLLPIPGESNGLLMNPSQWSARTKATVAFGQEISTSAVQIVTAATALANDGVRLQPHIVRRIVSPEGQTIERRGRTSVERVISAQTAQAMLAMMEEATKPGGTAVRAVVEGIRTSAKTGTAEVYDSEAGGYSDEDFIASCLAIFPTDEPRVIVYVAILKPKAGETYGGRIAAPIVREFSEEIVSYLGIPRSNDTVVMHDGVVTVPPRREIVIGAEMPDLTGLSKRELLPLLEIEDISLSIRGEGWVVRQSPAPGSPVTRGTNVVLELE